MNKQCNENGWVVWALHGDSDVDDRVGTSRSDTFAIELRTTGIHMPQPCALCGVVFTPRTLNGYCDGRAICVNCLPDGLRALQAIAYDRAYDSADKVLARSPDDHVAATEAAIRTLILVGADISQEGPS
jgi:hypothetical protein